MKKIIVGSALLVNGAILYATRYIAGAIMTGAGKISNINSGLHKFNSLLWLAIVLVVIGLVLIGLSYLEDKK